MSPLSEAELGQMEQRIADGDFDLALRAIDERLQAEPKNLELLRHRARILEKSGAFRELVPTLSDFGSALVDAGRKTEAIAVYRRSIELDNTQSGLQAELAKLTSSEPSSEPNERSSPGLDPGAALFYLFETDQIGNPLMERATFGNYRAGDILVSEGEPGTSLFVQLQGTTQVFTRSKLGEHIPLTELGPGDLFGEVAVLSGRPRTATITARTDVKVMVLEKQALDEVAQTYPQVYDLLQKFCETHASSTIEALIRHRRAQ